MPVGKLTGPVMREVAEDLGRAGRGVRPAPRGPAHRPGDRRDHCCPDPLRRHPRLGVRAVRRPGPPAAALAGPRGLAPRRGARDPHRGADGAAAGAARAAGRPRARPRRRPRGRRDDPRPGGRGRHRRDRRPAARRRRPRLRPPRDAASRTSRSGGPAPPGDARTSPTCPRLPVRATTTGSGVRGPGRQDLPAVDLRHPDPALLRTGARRRRPAWTRRATTTAAPPATRCTSGSCSTASCRTCAAPSGGTCSTSPPSNPRRRGAPHLHAAIRGTMPRNLIRQVVAATYHQVWWPAHDQPVYTARPRAGVGRDPRPRLLRRPRHRRPAAHLGAGARRARRRPRRRARRTSSSSAPQVDIQGVVAGTDKTDKALRLPDQVPDQGLGETADPTPPPPRPTSTASSRPCAGSPCSESCANWLLHGVSPRSPKPGMCPASAAARPTSRDTLGYGGRRCLVSRKWSGKTLDRPPRRTPRPRPQGPRRRRGHRRARHRRRRPRPLRLAAHRAPRPRPTRPPQLLLRPSPNDGDGASNTTRPRPTSARQLVIKEKRRDGQRDGGPLVGRRRLGVPRHPVKTLYQWKWRGEGPPVRKIGRHLRYVPDQVRAWATQPEAA